jgi:group I intron endonuclease
VGSSVDIRSRLINYFNYSYLELNAKLDRSLICKALLRYGQQSFSVEILEYCKLTWRDLKKTEQKYMDLSNITS